MRMMADSGWLWVDRPGLADAAGWVGAHDRHRVCRAVLEGSMMASAARSVLYVRLPCWKIYPGGVGYVADHVHKHRPESWPHILELALVAPAERKAVLEEHLRRLRPDVVAFSWRNMQSFGPHPEDDALDVVMNFDYSGSLRHR